MQRNRVRQVLSLCATFVFSASTFASVGLSATSRHTSDPYSVPSNTTDPVLVEQGVREWLTAHPDYDSARQDAILRRMRIESSYRPCASNGPYHALLQWANDRLRALYHHAGVRPGTCPSWLKQLEFMNYEIRHKPRFASFFRTVGLDAAYDNFTRVYEGAPGAALPPKETVAVDKRTARIRFADAISLPLPSLNDLMHQELPTHFDTRLSIVFHDIGGRKSRGQILW